MVVEIENLSWILRRSAPELDESLYGYIARVGSGDWLITIKTYNPFEIACSHKDIPLMNEAINSN